MSSSLEHWRKKLGCLFFLTAAIPTSFSWSQRRVLSDNLPSMFIFKVHINLGGFRRSDIQLGSAKARNKILDSQTLNECLCLLCFRETLRSCQFCSDCSSALTKSRGKVAPLAVDIKSLFWCVIIAVNESDIYCGTWGFFALEIILIVLGPCFYAKARKIFAKRAKCFVHIALFLIQFIFKLVISYRIDSTMFQNSLLGYLW